MHFHLNCQWTVQLHFQGNSTVDDLGFSRQPAVLFDQMFRSKLSEQTLEIHLSKAPDQPLFCFPSMKWRRIQRQPVSKSIKLFVPDNGGERCWGRGVSGCVQRQHCCLRSDRGGRHDLSADHDYHPHHWILGSMVSSTIFKGSIQSQHYIFLLKVVCWQLSFLC